MGARRRAGQSMQARHIFIAIGKGFKFIAVLSPHRLNATRKRTARKELISANSEDSQVSSFPFFASRIFFQPALSFVLAFFFEVDAKRGRKKAFSRRHFFFSLNPETTAERGLFSHKNFQRHRKPTTAYGLKGVRQVNKLRSKVQHLPATTQQP